MSSTPTIDAPGFNWSRLVDTAMHSSLSAAATATKALVAAYVEAGRPEGWRHDLAELYVFQAMSGDALNRARVRLALVGGSERPE